MRREIDKYFSFVNFKSADACRGRSAAESQPVLKRKICIDYLYCLNGIIRLPGGGSFRYADYRRTCPCTKRRFVFGELAKVFDELAQECDNGLTTRSIPHMTG